MQGFRKSDWRWSAPQHQKKKKNKNGRYYYKHLGLSLLLQWLQCSARGAQERSSLAQCGNCCRGSQGDSCSSAPTWSPSPSQRSEDGHECGSHKRGQKQHTSPVQPKVSKSTDPKTPQGDGFPHPTTDWSSGHGMGRTVREWESRIRWAPGSVHGGGCTGGEMWKLSQPFLSEIASRNSSNNNSLLLPFFNTIFSGRHV